MLDVLLRQLQHTFQQQPVTILFGLAVPNLAVQFAFRRQKDDPVIGQVIDGFLELPLQLLDFGLGLLELLLQFVLVQVVVALLEFLEFAIDLVKGVLVGGYYCSWS